ncbi:hypothetical protein OOK58_01690 [Streptomyces sp. NBC_01728]|uniref:hypothetical protein n=1 Tax=unclassified Streptomyces TaxID=2593676 RepID=UPI00224CBDC8|nr:MULTISPECIES: hypothetical protein [unclassified Streptomyces]MCX4404263.1 hypothetical protein [Streptomyces sp. NBC_01764]MCX4461410.1 hypothetical protein [Streptomyces sp. NBC_01719]MCX4490318.1 hypothetical protein [Streptomyces sp. NBC_01728]
MELHQFAALSANLTGFDCRELQETGMMHTYRQVVVDQAGAERLDRLAGSVAGSPDGPPRLEDDSARELARAITHLWYVGTWPGLPHPLSPDNGASAPEAGPYVVSSRAYEQGLVWRAFGGNAPGTAAQGHGSWADAPSEVAPVGARDTESVVAR